MPITYRPLIVDVECFPRAAESGFLVVAEAFLACSAQQNNDGNVMTSRALEAFLDQFFNVA